MDILVFKINKINYGCNLDEIDRVLEMADIQEINPCPDYILGLLNLSGDLIPVVDMAGILNYSRDVPPPPINAEEDLLSPYKHNTRLLIMTLSAQQFDFLTSDLRLALVMDGFQRIENIADETIQDVKLTANESSENSLLNELSINNNQAIQLINLKQVLRAEQIHQLI